MLRDLWNNRRGMSSFSLVGLLVAVGIVAALAVWVMPTYLGSGSTPSKTAPPGKAQTPTQRAESVECQSNLAQIRQAITMYQTNNERLPAQIQELTAYGVATSMLSCPVGGPSYTYGYDPQSGKVSCRYPGHERY